MKQLTLMPLLDGNAILSKDALSDPVLLSVLTDIHEQKLPIPKPRSRAMVLRYRQGTLTNQTF